MACLSGTIRIILAVLNLVLFIAFFALGIVGMLLRFNIGYVKSFMSSISTKFPSQDIDKIAKLIQEYGSGVSIAFIIIGFFVALIALFGMVALFCKVRFAAAIYLILLSVLTVIELAFLIYIAIPGKLHSLVDKAMDDSLQHIVDQDALRETSLLFWNIVGEENECCAMRGVADFEGVGDTVSLPAACCGLLTRTPSGNFQPPKCTIGNTHYSVPGCEIAIHKYVDNQKTLIVVVPACLLTFQILVMIVMGVFCSKWGTHDDYDY